MTIKIPPAALEAGCSAYTAVIYRGNGTQSEFRDAISAAFIAMIGAWPGTIFKWPTYQTPELILPLMQEKPDDKA